MAELPKSLGFLARMPPRVSAADSVSPLSPPITPSPPLPPCTNGSHAVLEPYRFSPDSFGWYGAIEGLGDPFEDDLNEYIYSESVGSELGVEFPLPVNWSTASGDSGILVNATFGNAYTTSADLGLFVQYFDLSDNTWHDLIDFGITLTENYVLTYLPSILQTLPTSLSITKIRIVLKIVTMVPGGGSPYGLVGVNYLTIPYCTLGPTAPLPPPPSPPLTEPSQTPDDTGTLPPFIEVEAPLPPLPPSPPTALPPLPPGSEILRPNRDILVRLWQPRPAFMQLNDPLNPDNPVDAAVPLYGPATVDTFDENNGNYIGTIRPRVEVGFTAPITEGPWDALQLRFRAARSRPPQPEPPAPPLPIPGTKEPATYPCPSDQTLMPRATDFPGVWQVPPLEQELTLSADDSKAYDSKNPCYVSAPVNVPPGEPGQIALMPIPVEWDAGWNQVKVRLVARARAAALGMDNNSISGVQASVIQFGPTGLLAETPAYQVRWNPFGCNDQLMAFQVSPTEISGTAVLMTNMDIHAEFFLTAANTDNMEIQISLDGVNYYGSVVFDLAAFQSMVIYYRIALNFGGLPTPIGNIAISAALMITGPYVVTGFDLIAYPNSTPPFIISVAPSILSAVPLVSQCRIGVSLQGNMELAQALEQYTDILVSDWLKYELTWNGFWSPTNIKDLRVRLSAEALLLESDVPFIDISAMDVIVSPYCPGLSQPLAIPLIVLNEVDVEPVADVSVTGWEPVPSWLMLLSDPTLATDIDVLADPRTNNQLLVQMAEPTGIPDVLPGYVREWITVEAIIQARIITWSSLSANLLVSTNLGQEQWTDALTQDQALYSIVWCYNPGLTTDQINRLMVAIIANSLSGNGEIQDPVEAAVCALKVRLTFQDVLISPPVLPPPSPPVLDTIMTIVAASPEVFSCGSLGNCSAPQGRIVGKVTVTNPDAVSATVNFIVKGRATLRISDASNNTYSLSQAIAGHASITYFIYAWVGDYSDPFPVDPADGGIIVSLIYSGGVHQIELSWYYIGL